MRIRERLSRLARLSPATIPRVVVNRLAASARSAKERFFYRPEGPRRSAPARSIRRLGILHADARAAGFGGRFRQQFPEDAEQILAEADRATRLVVDVLGSGPVDLEAFRQRSDLRLYPGTTGAAPSEIALASRIPWHFDFKAGVAWPPSTFFSDVAWGAAGVDIKVPWELSRCQHFVTLGQAYAITRDERFARAFSEQLEDWIRANPPKYGVNWACAMDVALRAANWLFAWDFFHDSPSVSAFVRERLPGALWEHGRHIRDHLEWGGELSSNHYLSDLLGLALIGAALEERDWWTFAARQMDEQMQNQTHADGMDFETSTAYHRLVTEIFFYFSMAAAIGNDSRSQALADAVSPEFRDRFREMGRLLTGLLDGQKRAPLVGDNDSGRVHVLKRRADADMGYLADLMALFFSEEALRPRGPGASDGAWLFGFEAVRALGSWGLDPQPELAGDPSGLATLRGPSDVLLFAAQPNGTRGIGNHTHNDKLSFTLAVGRDIFLTDPGTFIYTPAPAERNAFRSTRFHSTVEIDGQEQNRFPPGQLFLIFDDARGRITDRKAGTRLVGVHDGYGRLADPVMHQRSIERIGSPLSWIVEDEFSGAEAHDLVWTFVCGPDISVSVGTDNTARLRGAEGVLEIGAPKDLRIVAESGRVAPQYGVVRPTNFLRASWRGRLPFRATFTLVWTAGS